MLQIFRTNQFSVGILLLFYAVILKLGVFFSTASHEAIPLTGYLHERIQVWMPDSMLLQSAIGVGIVFLGGFLMTILVIRQRLELEVTLLSGVFYILVGAIIYNYLQPSGLTMGAILLILALHNMLSSPNKVHNSLFLFNTGLFIGMASLFYWSLWIFIIWAILGVFQLLGARLKETLMVVTGFIVPIFYQGFDYFWNGRFTDFKGDLFGRFLGIDTLPFPENDLKHWMAGGVILFLILNILAAHQKNIKKKQVIIRRKINVVYWMIPFILLAVIIQSNGRFGDLFLLAIPISTMMAFQFVRMKPGTAELVHIVLLGVAVYLSF